MCLILVLAALLFMAACAQPAPAPPAEPIVLKAVGFLPVSIPACEGYREYIKRVNEAAKGELIIDLLGGPEVIPGVDQDEAVRTGAMDMAMLAPSWYQRLLPLVETLNLSPLNLSEERETGYYDYLVERHKTINLMYIGRNTSSQHFYMFTNIKVDHPQELKGQRMRSAAKYDLFFKALGITPIAIPMEDIYTALERGLIDGYAESSDMVARGWHEVCKYMIFPGFYTLDAVTCINLDKFNSLPEHLQQLLLDVQRDYEPWLWEKYLEFDKANKENSKAHGVQFIEFTGEDAKWFSDLALNSRWDDMEKRVPEVAAKVKPMFEKK